MLNINTSQPVSWSTAPPTSLAPVAAVPAVGAVQAAARDGQSDASGRHGQGQGRSQAGLGEGSGRSAERSTRGLQAAPLLPRERSGRDESGTPAAQVEEARAQAERLEEEEQQAREQAERKLQLQEVLASVWKASAAVVDVVLGRESGPASTGEVAAVPGSKEISATGRRPAANDEAQVDLPGIDPVPAALRRDPTPEAYTEQGASSWAPLETGSLLSRRV
jgi:hypothetical protein